MPGSTISELLTADTHPDWLTQVRAIQMTEDAKMALHNKSSWLQPDPSPPQHGGVTAECRLYPQKET